VLRDGEFASITVRDVVPGDVIVIAPGSTYFDMVVLRGDLIVVDESALTGEATPVTKSELDSSMKDVKYDNNTHQSSAIYAGTEVLEVRKGSKELGLVTKTGSFTSKGELLSEVLSYQRHKLKFDDEVMIVVIILIFEAIFLVSLVYYFLDDQWVYAWFYGELEIISW
jgi:magnesium-transporting ATPase (P-type)